MHKQVEAVIFYFCLYKTESRSSNPQIIFILSNHPCLPSYYPSSHCHWLCLPNVNPQKPHHLNPLVSSSYPSDVQYSWQGINPNHLVIDQNILQKVAGSIARLVSLLETYQHSLSIFLVQEHDHNCTVSTDSGGGQGGWFITSSCTISNIIFNYIPILYSHQISISLLSNILACCLIFLTLILLPSTNNFKVVARCQKSDLSFQNILKNYWQKFSFG